MGMRRELAVEIAQRIRVCLVDAARDVAFPKKVVANDYGALREFWDQCVEIIAVLLFHAVDENKVEWAGEAGKSAGARRASRRMRSRNSARVAISVPAPSSTR